MEDKEKSSHDKINLNELTARIKKVIIELHNYSFFHGPSEFDKTDKRFVGRRGIINDIKSIILYSKKKTGAYLITGYRGMGKTSVVDEALTGIKAKPLLKDKLVNRTIRIFIMSLLILIVEFLTGKMFLHSRVLLYVNYCYLIIPIGFTILFLSKDRYSNLFVLEKMENRFTLLTLKRVALFKDFFFSTFIATLTYVTAAPLSGWTNNFSKFKLVFSTLIIHFYIISLFLFFIQIIFYCHSNKSKLDKYFSIEFLKSLLKKQLKKSNGYVFIKINLSYEQLGVKDILSLISKKTEQEYRKFIKGSGKRFSLKRIIIWYLPLLILTHYLYHAKPVYKFNHKLKEQLYVYNFFPSQLPVAMLCDSNFFSSMTIPNNNSYQQLLEISHNKNQTFIKDSLKLFTKTTDIKDFQGFPDTTVYYSALFKFTKVDKDKFDPTIHTFQKLIISADLFIYRFYYKIHSFLNDLLLGLLNSKLLNPTRVYDNSFKSSIKPIGIFKHLDFLYLFYFYLTATILNFLLSARYFGWTSKNSILNKLKNLNENINAEVKQEEGVLQEGFFKSLKSLFKTTYQSYSIADEREIENQLIQILNEMDSLSFMNQKPTFIYVFDELDKIEPFNKESIELKKDEANGQQSSTITPSQIRERQKTIFKLFSNLKYFLTTAKAKFFFIGGRELFDASLADISDRNFFIGSIFHKVFYVNSFLSDEDADKPGDITSMTERYVCQFLFPKKYIIENNLQVKGFNLKNYNKYLLTFTEFNEKNQNKPNLELTNVIAKQKREKIIYLLKQFILFLTHVSNGSPKKITMFFEESIKEYDSKKKLLHSNNTLVVSKKNNFNTLYLSFGYLTQMKLGFIYYLINPIVLSFINNKKDYGDKLLVSASFLLDYLYKFHRSAFSWRNLEHTPEIININKTPELRNFIFDIITFLKKSHIENIVSGLYQYKFIKKINREINFLSRTREDIAAAFNFTLDESLALKHYYNTLLNKLILNYNNFKGNEGINFVHSIASQHLILGDLHFYDEEYNEAIIHYNDSIHFLKKKIYAHDVIDNLSLILILFRTMLKLGFTYEKRRTYNSAYAVYGDLIKLFYDYIGECKNQNSFFSISQVDIVENNLLVSSLENIRLFYQPTLSRLFIIEKSNLDGITLVNLSRSLNDIQFLESVIFSSEKYIILTEFYNKLSDILFFKNSLLVSNNEATKYDCKKINNKTIIEDYNKYEPFNNKNSCRKINIPIEYKIPYTDANTDTDTNSNLPCWSCFMLSKSLDNLLINFINNEKTGSTLAEKLIAVVNALKSKTYRTKRSESLILLGKVLSSYSDTLLSCISNRDENYLSQEFYLDFFDIVENKNYKKIEKKLSNNDIHTNELVYYLNYLSAICYKKANSLKEYSFQLTKILYIIKENLKLIIEHGHFGEINLSNDFIVHLESSIVKKAIKGFYLTYDSVHRLEISLLKDIFTKDEKIFDRDKISLSRISITDDIEEILITFSEIKLTFYELNRLNNPSATNINEFLQNITNNNVFGPYNLNDNVHNRILRLSHKEHINYCIYRYVLNLPSSHATDFESDFINKLQDNESKKIFKPFDYNNLLEYLIYDSIFSLMEILKLSKLYDYSYLLNHSFIGYKHMYLSQWIYIYKFLYSIYNVMENKNPEKESELFLKTRYIIKLKSIMGYLMDEIRIINSENDNKTYSENDNKTYIELLEILKKEYNELKKKKSIEELKDKSFKINYGSLFQNVFKSNQASFFNVKTYFINREIRNKINSLNSLALPSRNLKKRNIIKKRTKEFKQNLLNLIGTDNLAQLSSNYHTEQAINHFYSSEETHSGSVAYRNFMEKMFFLNDDLSDNLDHFFAALERYKLNSNMIESKRNLLKSLYKYSQPYDSDRYMETIK